MHVNGARKKRECNEYTPFLESYWYVHCVLVLESCYRLAAAKVKPTISVTAATEEKKQDNPAAVVATAITA